MTPIRTNAPATTPELAGELAGLYQVEAYNVASSISISSVPPNPGKWLDEQGELSAASESDQSFTARFGRLTLRLPDSAAGTGHIRPVGLREMTLTARDVAELRRRIEHPSATPKIPLRAVPEEEPGDLF